MTGIETAGLRNARLVDGRLVDVRFAGGVVEEVIVAGAPGDRTDIPGMLDVGGSLVLPSLVEAHAHLDKAYTGHVVANPSGDLRGAMDSFYEAGQRGDLGHDECVARATDALWAFVDNGVTAVRSHVDVGVGTSFDHAAAVTEAVASMRGIIDVQLVALMYAPLTGIEGAENRRLLARALELGFDAVGGAPQLEPDPVRALEVMLQAASDFDVAIDVHLDETLDASVVHIERLAELVLDRAHVGRVSASHCVSLGMQPPARQRQVAELIARAGIDVVCLPQSNLYLQGRDHPRATPRGIAPVAVLREHGVTVCGGGDNIRDPFNPLGRADPLDTAVLLVLASHQSTRDAIDMVTGSARRVLGLDRVEVEAGAPADLVVFGAPDPETLLATTPLARRTVRRGRLLATTSVVRQRH